ncbi:endonuclease SmrB [Idiomarina seosinensis]|uniref:endonuclease SmrB n=1 Tax=Idiomarina seosinensis TaxID=281739 RepID=UPI003850B51A
MKSKKRLKTELAQTVTDDDIELFRQAARGAKTLTSDRVQPLPARQRLQKKQRRQQTRAVTAANNAAADVFSDQFQGYLGEGPVRYVAEGESPYLAKQLRRGDYSPDMLLDLHGMTLATAKLELTAMLQACEQQLIECCSVMHGHGSGRLKEQVPHWLIQYPGLRAFHQAPKTWGGDAAILILIKRRD